MHFSTKPQLLLLPWNSTQRAKYAWKLVLKLEPETKTDWRTTNAIVCVQSHDYDVREMSWLPCWRSNNIAQLSSWQLPLFWLVPKTERRIQTIASVRYQIVTNQGEETKILSTERKTWWLAVISWANLTETILENDHVWDFHSGKAAYLWDWFTTSWVSSLHLVHNKLKE